MSRGLSRRSFLIASGATVALLIAGGQAIRGRGAAGMAERIANQFGGNPGSTKVGKAYLKAHPDEAHIEHLVGQIVQDQSIFTLFRSDQYLVEKIRDAVREDFSRGNTVTVANWILSRTEARVLALVSLVGVQKNS